MKKGKWVIWLSVPGFMILWADTARRILIPKPFKRFSVNDGKQFNLWVEAWGRALTLFVGYIMIPMVLLSMGVGYFKERNPTVSLTINIIQIIALYFLGVHITKKLYDWRIKVKLVE